MKGFYENVCIVGMGHVGIALYERLSKDNPTSRYILVDDLPQKVDALEVIYGHNENTNFEYDLYGAVLSNKVDIVCICLPTPCDASTGRCDAGRINTAISNVYAAKVRADGEKRKIPILLKSTVSPDFFNYIDIRFPDSNIIYAPEFMVERFGVHSMREHGLEIFGVDDGTNRYGIDFSFFEAKGDPEEDTYNVTSQKNASYIKYIANTFLAMKVIFFNEIYDLVDSERDYIEIVNILRHDKRIGSSHMDVPGHDGKRGYGGSCFPKDVTAFISYAKAMKKNLGLLEAADSINRNRYK